jgi:hypothetical protein
VSSDLDYIVREWIENNFSFAEEEHSHYYADEDHEHDYEQVSFEDKVNEYLGNFEVGTGCGTQRAFENAVRKIVDAYAPSMRDMHPDTMVRTMLRGIIAAARDLPAEKVVTILARTSTDLMELVRKQKTGDLFEETPQFAEPSDV